MWLLWAAIAVSVAVVLRYCACTPLPCAIGQQWKLLLLDALLKTAIRLVKDNSTIVQGSPHHTRSPVRVMERLGLGRHVKATRRSSKVPEATVKKSTAEPGAGFLTVSDVAFDGVPVRVYQPLTASEDRLRRGLLYIHGGGWAYGSAKDGAYDRGSCKMSKELNMVVVSVDYRLYPETRFPTPYLECLTAAKRFLSPGVLAEYGVDPERVAISGDSAGGNLAAALAQEIAMDDSVRVKFSVQALIYPALQALDFNTPSYQQNRDMVILNRPLMVQFWLQYLGGDLSLKPHLLANEHSFNVAPEFRAGLDWTALLLPEHQKDYFPVRGEGPRGILDEVPGLLDVRAAPLLAGREVLAKCPRAYVMTCEYDVLRDDGLMYARRLRDAGVEVTAEHHRDGFHGCFTLTAWPFEFDVGVRAFADYVRWLRDNL
ncbi:neutral cholesterol ester hydrolase 1-like isoform X2 [Phyllopteryx taeniolatus]|uniref:neutral cholesterol ester hydrolase 1-like isoform X2 n=1 Tax=Phyllopteryx taeniolatus TaxID=161469 RepID=UPI002AD59036|nr:neutral cholesterol ester hydrolase 1-like isoform X2 [Phyllopteryx taeniolatus]